MGRPKKKKKSKYYLDRHIPLKDYTVLRFVRNYNAPTIGNVLPCIPIYYGSSIQYSVGDLIYPEVSYKGVPIITATPYEEYAVVLAGSINPFVPTIRYYFPTNKERKEQQKQLIEVEELVPDAFHNAYECPGYVYTLSGDFRFVPSSQNGEIFSNYPATVTSVKKIDNLFTHLNSLNQITYDVLYYGMADWSTRNQSYEQYMAYRYGLVEQFKQQRQAYAEKLFAQSHQQ